MMKHRWLLMVSMFVCFTGFTHAAEKPNILWIYQEDTSPWMGSYGHEINKGWTPNIDKMAENGVRFSRAYVPSPVCSSCRSGMMVGANAIRFGAHEHRSRRGKNLSQPLPNGIKILPQLLQEVGYFTFNIGKSDYNYEVPLDTLYPRMNKNDAKTPWRQAKKGQPWFGQIQLRGGKNNTSRYPKEKKTDPSKVTVPGDYPQNQLYREVVAQHYDAIRLDDEIIGGILQRLKEDGQLENTIVVYFSDHGANNLVRHKQMPTEGGLHVPFVIQGPEKWVPAKGVVRKDLVSTLDLTATTMIWGGIKLPEWCEGRDLFAKDFQPRTFVGSAKDRLDQTIDRVRSIRTERYRYTRNYKLDRVLLQPQYRDGRPFMVDIRKAYANGTLAPHLKKIYFGEREAEELYDVEKDPAQLNNLAKNPKYADVLEKHRTILATWLEKGDMGAGNEPDDELRYNGEGKKWGEGVNAEYERIRVDTDGDGLSDKWEKLNGRDGNDGKLRFEFNNGGWQTEGWLGFGKLTNIAGYQGFLDFELLEGNGYLIRDSLNLDTTKNQGDLVIRMKSTDGVRLTLSANSKSVGQVNVKAGKNWQDVRIPLKGKGWQGRIKRLAIQMASQKSAVIEIDWIRVVGK